MRLVQSKALLGITALAVALAFGGTAHAVTVNKCAAAKTKCVTGKVKGLLGCHQKAEGKSLAVDPACIAKAEAKFTACYGKAEAKPPCLSTGDTAAQEAAIDAFVLDVVQELDPGYPVPVTNKCSVGKKKNVAAKTAGKLGCLAKAFGKAPGTVDPACVSKAEAKFASAWAKLEAKPPCLTTGDAAALEAKVDAFISDMTNAIGGSNPCPTKVVFSGTASAPESILDTGWTGISHRTPIISNGDVTVAVACANPLVRPCGTCTVSGPIANSGAGQLSNHRCINDTSVHCTTNANCSGVGGTCEFIFGSNLSLAAGGVTTCVVNQFNGPVSGTANIESGEAATNALLTSRVYNGIAIDNPCPRCIGDTTINDGVLGGTCDAGPRAGLTCDGNGQVFNRPDFGTSSLDCPPNPAGILATLPIDLSNATDPVVRTVTASSPGCSGEPGEKCMCDTCNNANADPCDANGDCPDPAGPIGPICGGKRCVGGTNNGAACNNNTECPSGGICGKVGEPTKPSACLDDTATVGVLDCLDGGDGEGTCTQGPITQTCSVGSGHAQRSCTVDANCGGGVGSCLSTNRNCFLTGTATGTGKVGTTTLIAVGMEDTPVNDVSDPTLAAVFCVGPTSAGAVNNVAGLPGPSRITIKGHAVGTP